MVVKVANGHHAVGPLGKPYQPRSMMWEMLSICKGHPYYDKFLTSEYKEKMLLPAITHRKACFVELVDRRRSEKLFYTWARPVEFPSLTEWPPEDSWTEEGPLFWIVNTCMTKGMDPKTYLDAMVEDGLRQGLVRKGEKVLYWRAMTGRLGWLTI